jgi:hypothetical protein
MPIYEFELMHGAVLTRLCRNDQPLTLSLIVTRDEHWSAYWIGDAILYIKYATHPYEDRQGKLRWQFTFTPDHIADLKDLMTMSDEVYLALVCAHHKLEGTMEICLVEPLEIDLCLDLEEADTQWIAVECEPRKRLRVYGPLNSDEEDKLIIPRKRLDEWRVPGR